MPNERALPLPYDAAGVARRVAAVARQAGPAVVEQLAGELEVDGVHWTGSFVCRPDDPACFTLCKAHLS